MDTSSSDAIQFAHEENQHSTSPNWYVLLFAVIITLFAVYWGFVRPTSRQLTKLRRYVTSLEASIADLNGQRDTNAATISLLDQMIQQEQATKKAIVALEEMRQLHRQIVTEADQLSSAREALENFVDLRTQVARQSSLIESTSRALSSAEALRNQIVESSNDTHEAKLAVERVDAIRDGLIDSIESLDDAKPILDRVEALQDRLASSAQQTSKARAVSEELLKMEEELLNRGSYTESAQLALGDLIDLRDQVEAQAATVEKADATLDQMVTLHSNVAAQADVVATAIETLELSSDVQVEMRRAGDTMHGVKRMLTEMVMMQPALKQAMDSLQPLAELSDLRRLDVKELRKVANVITTRHTAITQGFDEAPAEVVADANDSTVK